MRISDWSSDVCSSDLATMNRFCGSSMYAIHVDAGQIAMGAGDAFIAGGVESMTMVPQGGFNFSPNQRFDFDGQPGMDQFYDAFISMGQTAATVAPPHSFARTNQYRLALPPLWSLSPTQLRKR